MLKARINLFAPDPEETLFGRGTNNPDDAVRLRRQLLGLARVAVTRIAPSYQGSFDVTLYGDAHELKTIFEELMVVQEDIEWL